MKDLTKEDKGSDDMGDKVSCLTDVYSDEHRNRVIKIHEFLNEMATEEGCGLLEVHAAILDLDVTLTIHHGKCIAEEFADYPLMIEKEAQLHADAIMNTKNVIRMNRLVFDKEDNDE